MTKRKRYDVSPHGDGWKVQWEDAGRPSNVYDSKDPAVERATDLAKRSKPSQVRIRKKDGRIQEERTYGDDPHPPQG